LSTIEAAGMLLSRLERRPEIEEKLTAMLDRVREHGAAERGSQR
jgi:hypothetical protein